VKKQERDIFEKKSRMTSKKLFQKQPAVCWRIKTDFCKFLLNPAFHKEKELGSEKLKKERRKKVEKERKKMEKPSCT